MKWPFVSRARFDEALKWNRQIVTNELESALAWAKREKENAATQQASHDVRCESYTRTIGQLQQQLIDERARSSDLLDRYHALKLQGASTPEPTPVLPEKPYNPVLSAVNDACAGKDAKIRAGMLKQVALDKEAGLKLEDIILRIQRGNRPAEEVG